VGEIKVEGLVEGEGQRITVKSRVELGMGEGEGVVLETGEEFLVPGEADGSTCGRFCGGKLGLGTVWLYKGGGFVKGEVYMEDIVMWRVELCRGTR
jgi:hypothetical protein